MSPQDRQILNEHVAFMRRVTETSKRSHGWTFDDEIAALERVLNESLTFVERRAAELSKPLP
jgi:hypothetical protein